MRYAPHDNKIEKMRPMLAARELITHVLDAAGLAVHNEVQQEVLALAARHGVRVHQDKLRIDDPVDVLKDVGATPLAREVACLDAVVTILETDLGNMQARARAWALGDVDALRQIPHADDRAACIAAVSTSERVRTLIARAQDDWLVAVTDSLARNRGTLAVQSMERLLGEHGALATLRARGYAVEGPSALESAQPHAMASEASAAAPVSHCGTRSNTCRLRGKAAVAPSSTPTAKPARCATTSTSVPSPPAPVQPSRTTPAMSGPQRRAQRCGSAKCSRQE
jgi:hypothetical protein